VAELWLLRHSETEWSRTRRHTGRTDVPLTEKGRAEAAALRERLAGRSWALALSSPLSRARETAELAGLSVEEDPDLLEWDYGAYEGVTTADIREERPGWYLWTDGCPDGEMPGDVAARVDRVIARVLAADGDAVLAAHGHVLRMLGARWLEGPPELGGRLYLSTGSVSVLGWEREVRVVRRWNG